MKYKVIKSVAEIFENGAKLYTSKQSAHIGRKHNLKQDVAISQSVDTLLLIMKNKIGLIGQ